MATITEDYVSFKTAKLLKKKKFDEICYLGYNKNGEYVLTSNRTNSQIIQPDFCFICCPTLQMAIKWLRKTHNLYIESYVIKNYNNKKLEYTYSIQDLDFNGSDDGIECCKNWNSPEEACEAAIIYSLENLTD